MQVACMKVILSFQFCAKETFSLAVITIYSHKIDSQPNSLGRSFVVNICVFLKRCMGCLFAINNASFEILHRTILLLSTIHLANKVHYNLILLCLELVKKFTVNSNIKEINLARTIQYSCSGQVLYQCIKYFFKVTSEICNVLLFDVKLSFNLSFFTVDCVASMWIANL